MSETEAVYKVPEIVEKANGLQKKAASPIDIDQLAQLQGIEGVTIIRRRVEILDIARRGSIARTFPRDWVLFKADSGVYAYLQDSGCERMKDIWGISIENVSDFISEKQEDGSTVYVVTGDGYSSLTRSRVEKVIGARDSGSMLMGRSDVPPAELRIDTMKAARSNLDGSIIRHLAGLASVPIEELNKIFGRSDPQDLTGFNLGKGFGKQTERHGGTPEKTAEYGAPPACPKCKSTMRFFAGKDGREPFWGCPKYKDCGQKPITAKKVKAKEPIPEQDGEDQDFGEGPPEKQPEQPATEAARIGEIKNRMLADLKKAGLWENALELRRQILEAKTTNELFDLELSVKEAVQSATPKKGGK